MWKTAADLLKAVRRYPVLEVTSPRGLAASPVAQSPGHDTIPQSELDRLSALYLAFTNFMDVVPRWASLPERSDGEVDAETVQYRVRTYWAMRSNMMAAFHCLKLMILQECSSRGLHSVMGLTDSEVSLAVRKMDIAQDFLSELQTVPFESFKMQGEPGASCQPPRGIRSEQRR